MSATNQAKPVCFTETEMALDLNKHIKRHIKLARIALANEIDKVVDRAALDLYVKSLKKNNI